MRRFERKNGAAMGDDRRSFYGTASAAILNLTPALLALGLGLLGVGCAASGVGDPCTPEAVPRCGFAATEVYVETSSVQCRTRVCVVYRLDGHPENLLSAGCPLDSSRSDCATTTDPSTCVDDTPRDEADTSDLGTTSVDRVFCSCRCRALETNPDLPLCVCGTGYHCSDEDFCVPDIADPRFCNSAEHPHCPGRCDLATQRCP